MKNINDAIQLATTADMKNAIRFEYRIGQLWEQTKKSGYPYIGECVDWSSGNYVATRLAPKTDRGKWNTDLYDCSAREPDELGESIVDNYVAFLENTAQAQLAKVMPDELTRQIESAFPGDNGDIGTILYASKKDIVRKMAEYFPVYITVSLEQESRKASSKAEENSEIRPTVSSSDFRNIYEPLFRRVLGFSKELEGGTAAEA